MLDTTTKCLAGFLVYVVGVLVVPSTATGELVTVTFDNDPVDEEPYSEVDQPFTSVDSSLVHFSGRYHDDYTGPSLLLIGLASRPVSNGTNALGVLNHPEGRAWIEGSPMIAMQFDVPINSLSVDFGNDQNQNDLEEYWMKYVELSVYNGEDLVDRVLLEANLDYAMNQTITYSGESVDSATLAYITSSGGYATSNGEVVDNVTFNTVPEPGTIALWSIALLTGLVASRRLRSGSA